MTDDNTAGRNNHARAIIEHTTANRAAVQDELLTITEVADILRAPVATLGYWRHLGTGPHNFRIGPGVRARSEGFVPPGTHWGHPVATRTHVKAVQRMLGHASAAMTLDVYSGLFDDDLDGVAERLDAGARVYSMCTDAPVVPLTAESAGR